MCKQFLERQNDGGLMLKIPFSNLLFMLFSITCLVIVIRKVFRSLRKRSQKIVHYNEQTHDAAESRAANAA